MAETDTNRWDSISRTVQVISVVVGVVVSVLSFNQTRQKDADARLAEAQTRKFESQKYSDQRKDEADRQQIEAAKPFLELRQQRYMEALQAAGVLASPKDHTPDQIRKAQTRFWELYWAELSMVEEVNVEGAMMQFGSSLSPDADPASRQDAAYKLAHALRDSLTHSWGIDEKKEGKVNP